MMKMEDFSARVPAEMSGGQQQRIALARALIMESGVLLFDEPLSNLDAKLRLHMRDEIRKIQREFGITTIYVTHDQHPGQTSPDNPIMRRKNQFRVFGSNPEGGFPGAAEQKDYRPENLKGSRFSFPAPPGDSKQK